MPLKLGTQDVTLKLGSQDVTAYLGAEIVSLDPDAAAYLAAVEEADGESLEPAVRTAIADFIVGCKSDGIWDAIKASCILAGARTLAGALVPLRGTAPTNNNFTASDYNRETGLVGDGSTTYLDSNRAGDDDPQNDAHLAAYVSTVHDPTPLGGAGGVYLGNGGTSTGASQIGRAGINNTFGRSRSATFDTAGSTPPLAGMIGANRSQAADYILRSEQTNNTITRASETPDAGNVFVFAREDGSGGAALPTNARLAFYSIGESLDLAALDTRVTALITAIGNAL